MLTQELIKNLKNTSKEEMIELISQQNDVNSIYYILTYIRNTSAHFESEVLNHLLKHDHKKIRLHVVKSIGKLKVKSHLYALINQFKSELNTTVKREIVSSLGRQRSKEFVPFFIEVLEDEDPKIVCQAVRSLFVFEKDYKVQNRLKELVHHPNEIVREVIYKQYFSKEKTSENKLSHTETYGFLKNVVVHADVLEVLDHVPEDSIHLTFTSPPYYNAKDYSIYPSYEAYLDFLESTFQEVHRVTKEGRFLIVNTSPIIIPRMSRAHSSKRYGIPFDLHTRITRNGWEFIDDIIWLKSEFSVKNRVGGFMQHRKPLGYKPNTVTEYLMVYRRETSQLLDWNIKNYPCQTIEESKVKNEYETNNVWKIDPCFNKVHSAVFPVELCKKVIQYYSYKGDLVFDPFGGSGTLGRVAKKLERLFFLTEKNTTYFEYIKKTDISSLFSERKTRFLTIDQFKNEINHASH